MLMFGHRGIVLIMCRSPRCSKHSEIKRGTWTTEEDMILREYISVHHAEDWMSLPTKAGLKRCGRSCRLRWLNYLRPDIKRGNISSDEDDLILRLHRLLGNRWSLIAGRLPGRTDNEIKNHWTTRLGKKSLPKNHTLSKPSTQSKLNTDVDGDNDIHMHCPPVRASPVRLSDNHVLPLVETTHSPSMQTICQPSPPCLPNLTHSTLLAEASSLHSYQLQSVESDLHTCPCYSPEDFDLEGFLTAPCKNLEGEEWLHGLDKRFNLADFQGMEEMDDWVDELEYF